MPKTARFRLSDKELAMEASLVFNKLDKIGEGSYGAVFKAIHKNSGTVCALKIVPIETDLEDLQKEINVMNECDSIYITAYYGSYVVEDHLWVL